MSIGVIVVSRKKVEPFTERQIELVATFADQAVIAIENVRLFEEVQARTRELSEALEQQTATSEVLQVISSSPGELEPVFEAMLANATRICEAKFGIMWLREGREGDTFRCGALYNAPPAWAEARQREPIIHAHRGNSARPSCADEAGNPNRRHQEGAGLREGDPTICLTSSNSGAPGRFSPYRCSRRTS